MTRHKFRLLRTLLIVTAVTGIVSNTWAQQSLIPGHTVVLKGMTGRSLFQQCSRSSPTGREGYWDPTAPNIKQIEVALPGYLSQQKLPTGTSAKYLSGYYFQCVGFIRKKHHIVYLNAFSPSVKDSMAHDTIPDKKRPFNWKIDPVSVCDGGDSFYGIEYDVETKKFSNLSFNGMG